MVPDVEMSGNLTVKGILQKSIQARRTHINIINPWVFEPTAGMLYETRFQRISQCVNESGFDESDDYETVFVARDSNIYNVDNR